MTCTCSPSWRRKGLHNPNCDHATPDLIAADEIVCGLREPLPGEAEANRYLANPQPETQGDNMNSTNSTPLADAVGGLLDSAVAALKASGEAHLAERQAENAELEQQVAELATKAAEMEAEKAALERQAAEATALSAAIAEADHVCSRASLAARIAAEQAQPYLEAAQRAAQVLDAAQVRLHGLLEQAKGDVAT